LAGKGGAELPVQVTKATPRRGLPGPDNDLLRHELLRQRDILDRDIPFRFVAVSFAYAISLVFLPLSVVAGIAAVNLAAEVIAHRLMRDIDRLMTQRWRHTSLIAASVLFEISFVLPAGLMWHLDDPYAKALAVGMVATTMTHISTVRAIHLPIGLGGAAGIGIVVLVSNSVFWGGQRDWGTLALTTLTALAGMGYFVSALLSNNRLHRETAAGWAGAQAANVAKTRFLAQISHELRTPLNAILGIGHAELTEQTDPSRRDRLALLVDAAAGLGVLLDDLLDLAALEEGKLPIRPAPLDPAAAIAATVALFRSQARQAGLALTLSLGDDLPAAGLADGQRLRQCLSNILSNALKYTENGSIRVTAGMDAAQMLRIEVADSGPGVPEDMLDAIFVPFQRGPGPQPGTGLGLAISRTLARRMGGDLVVIPAVQGARFCLTLTLGRATTQDLPPKAPPTPTGCLQGLHILVVDDIATNRLVASLYLRHLGAQVTEAESGAAALALVAQKAPAAVLLDMNMPGMSGIETLRGLRAIRHGGPRLPVIAMTADASEAHCTACLRAGMDGYVAKPLTPERLAAALLPHVAAQR